MSETPLARKLRRLIEEDGPIGVDTYMAHCLGDPAHGYYMTRDPFGARGDFVTAPDVSQMFGEILGAWLIHAWRQAGAPSPARMVELGPGRGTLMADILRVADKAPDFSHAVSVHLVETSPVLAAVQAETLRGRKIDWHDAFRKIPEGPVFLVANEFFDALPVRQFVREDGAWHERVVGLDAAGNLSFGLGPGRLPDAPQAKDGSILEIRPAADAMVADISVRIACHDGAALFVDYGHAESGVGETLQAVRGHNYADPLDAPGESDLTAHVDFSALACRAAGEGIAVHGPLTQGEFLLKLGLRERAVRLASGADAAASDALQAAVQRLSGPTAMGRLFKVLALTRRGLHPPPF